MDELKIIEKLN